MKVEALHQYSPPPCRVHRLGGQRLGNSERRDAITLRRGAHEVHEAGRAKRSRSQVRSAQNEGLRVDCSACGVFWRAGQQLAWPRAKRGQLEWHAEVDFGTEIYQCCGIMSRVADHNMDTVVTIFEVAVFGNLDAKPTPGEPG